MFGCVALKLLINASYEGLSGPVKPVSMLSLTTGPELGALVAAPPEAEAAAEVEPAPPAAVVVLPAPADEEPDPQAVTVSPHARTAARESREELVLRMSGSP
jgi:hypothetical protein